MALIIERVARWMIARDLPEVLAIEEEAFAWDAWTEEELRAVLCRRNVIGIVCESARSWNYGPILGFMVYELCLTRVRILDFAVHPAHQREGVGRNLIDTLKGKLSVIRRRRLVCDVAEENLPMQKFLRSEGFRATAIHHPYPDSADAAYRFVYRLPKEASHGS